MFLHINVYFIALSLGMILAFPQNPTSLSIVRHHDGDMFRITTSSGTNKQDCNDDFCIGLSSGTATLTNIPGAPTCTCRCHQHLPAFREDLGICVEDIHECVLAPFVGGSTSEQIPFVFLPLKGQIIHPSKEISFSGINTPVCAVSGAKFLSEAGWIDLKNSLDSDVPFRLFRDEGRTFLQWVGEPGLRAKMSGHLVLVYLMCKEITDESDATAKPSLFSPCVSFRIVGTPISHSYNVSEVAFIPDAHSGDAETSSHLTISEYVAIGICSILLGLIYVASVFLYLHLRKRNKLKDDKPNAGVSQTMAEEGVVKNNPLLGMNAQFHGDSDYTSSDNDNVPDLVMHDDRKKHIQTTAIVHPHLNAEPANLSYHNNHEIGSYQDSQNMERLPEENVSIVETLEHHQNREDREDIKAISGVIRKKLYFNPAYFEPHLLLAPPPAAIEFLIKIREVITIAKQKMALKRYRAGLMAIPEEDRRSPHVFEYNDNISMTSRKNSFINLKRENSRRRTSCSGCPGCESNVEGSVVLHQEFSTPITACKNCAIPPMNQDSKQRSIRKWLEDVPVLKQDSSSSSASSIGHQKPTIQKRVRSPTRSLPPDTNETNIRALSPRPASERGPSPIREKPPQSKKVRKPKMAPPAPPQQKSTKQKKENLYDTVQNLVSQNEVEGQEPEDIRIPTLTKQQMKAVINELSIQSARLISGVNVVDYETDSLERSVQNSKEIGSSDGSSHPSPSLSTALPLEEELTMRNAIFNTKTGNRTISKINMQELLLQKDQPNSDNEDYQLVVLKNNNNNNAYNPLSHLLQRNAQSKGYSLVSEVYVNNGYNYSSDTSNTNSNNSTLERPKLKVRYTNQPGKLMIEVEDCPDNYIPVNDSDSYESDTLDRKQLKKDQYVDSLERPNQIQLRSSGSFHKSLDFQVPDKIDFNTSFGSLRDIYAAKSKGTYLLGDSMTSLTSLNDEDRMLTLEERQKKRQRNMRCEVPPDVIPPPPHDDPIYQRPKPPRPVHDLQVVTKPPLPPKNVKNRNISTTTPITKTDSKTSVGIPEKQNEYFITSAPQIVLQNPNKNNNESLKTIQTFINTELKKENWVENNLKNTEKNINVEKENYGNTEEMLVNSKKSSNLKKAWRKIVENKCKPEDSGYLSSDSNESRVTPPDKESETDESFGDGHSESGAESVETHSVFFGRFSKARDQATTSALQSLDSGLGSNDISLKGTQDEVGVKGNSVRICVNRGMRQGSRILLTG